MRKRIYVTGPISRMNEFTLRNSHINLSLLCRKIILLGHIPICLTIAIEECYQDIRVKKTSWDWLEATCLPVMDTCEYLCYIPEMAGMRSSIVLAEKEIWRNTFGRRMVSSDMVAKFLLEGKETIYGTGD